MTTPRRLGPRQRLPQKREYKNFLEFNVLVRGRRGIFVVNQNDIYIGRAMIDYGEYGELEWALLQQLCGVGDIVNRGWRQHRNS